MEVAMRLEQLMKDAIRSRDSGSESMQIREAQVRLLYRQGPVALIAALLLAVLLTALLWNAASHAVLVAWLGCSAIVYLARLGLVLAFMRASPVGEATIQWGIWFAVGNFITGLLWGATAILIFPHVTLIYQTMICFFLAAIVLGTVTMYFPRKEVYTPFALAACLPLAGLMIQQGGSVLVTMGMMVLVFVIVILVAGNRMYNALAVSLKLRFENQDLIQSLVEEKAAIGRLNESLLSEIGERKQVEQTLRQSETRFRELAELLPVFIYEFDVNGRFTFLNRSGLELGGYTSEDVSGGLTVSEVVMPEDRDKAAQNMRSVMSGESLSGEKYTLLKKNGGTAPIETWSIPVVHDDKIVGVRGVGVDITDRKKAEDQIQASLKEKEVLLREIHHRVKNNLSVISSLLSLRAHYSKDQAIQAAFHEIEDRIRSMALAHEMLYQSDSLAELDMKHYVGKLLNHLASSIIAPGRAIELKNEAANVSFGLDTAIPLGFLLTELVSNCFKHAFPDREKGEIRVSLDAIGEERFQLIVADNGIGIPADVDWENPPSLGLELVKIFVDQLHGESEITTDNGTEVRVRFKDVKKSRRID